MNPKFLLQYKSSPKSLVAEFGMKISSDSVFLTMFSLMLSRENFPVVKRIPGSFYARLENVVEVKIGST